MYNEIVQQYKNLIKKNTCFLCCNNNELRQGIKYIKVVIQ